MATIDRPQRRAGDHIARTREIVFDARLNRYRLQHWHELTPAEQHAELEWHNQGNRRILNWLKSLGAKHESAATPGHDHGPRRKK